MAWAHHGLLARAMISVSEDGNHRPHAVQGIWKASDSRLSSKLIHHMNGLVCGRELSAWDLDVRR